MSRRLSILILGSLAIVFAAAQPALAKRPALTDEVQRLLGTLSAAEGAASRKEAAAALVAMAAEAAETEALIAALTAHLARSAATTDDERRAVLKSIKADIPDSKGRFRAPGRQKEDEILRDDDFDWLAALLEQDGARSGYGEVLSDVAALRALSAMRTPSAAQVILDVGFGERGLLYRDECGRRLRKMTPYSLPALIASSNNRDKDGSLRRYATYQLDRMDRQDPLKVLNDAAAEEMLLVATIQAYGAAKERTAVGPVLGLVNDGSARVRAAARETWMGFVTGPPPPEAPKRKLTLPGGKLSDEEEPLWLTYRELADIEIRRTHQEVLGVEPKRRAGLVEMSEAVFAHYDAARAKAGEDAYNAAAAHAEAGDHAAATKGFDTLLAVTPAHPKRAEMARSYFAHGQALEAAESWDGAAAAYSKAHGLDPDGPLAKDALGRHYNALGKGLEASGKDGSASFRQAADVSPGQAQSGGQRAPWMLYAGLSGGALAAIFVILGLALRRRE